MIDHCLRFQDSSHADKLRYVFGITLSDVYRVPNTTTTDVNVFKTAMTLWTNFAKSG